MKIKQQNSACYEVVYNQDTFCDLEYVRRDHICDEYFVTLKNILTGEYFTFEENKIREMKKKPLQVMDVYIYNDSNTLEELHI